MHRAAGYFHAIGKGLLLRLEARKRRQQRRMDIENPRWKLLHQPRREQPHVTGEAHEIDLMIQQSGRYCAVMLFAPGLPVYRHCLDAASAGNFQAGSIGAVRNHDRNARIGNPSSRDAVGDGDKI